MYLAPTVEVTHRPTVVRTSVTLARLSVMPASTLAMQIE
jgi:hypothetical protein